MTTIRLPLQDIRRSDVVVLSCTLFPLVASLVREVSPECLLVDPAEGIAGVLNGSSHTGPNRLTIALTGAAISLEDVQTQTPVLFPGWDIEATGAFTLTWADTRARGAR